MEANPTPLGDRARELRELLVPFISKRVDPQDVEDVLQNVFVRIQRSLGDLRDSDKLVPWGYQIARNVIVDHTRRATVRKHEELDRVRSIAAPQHLADDSGASELALILDHFIGRLSDPYREALQLTELDGMTQAEAAEQVGLSLPGMKSRVQRGRAQLRELLESCCDIELDTRRSIIDVDPTNPPVELPNCCSTQLVHPSRPTRVSRDMRNTQQTSNNESINTKTTDESATGCCGGPAPAGTDACCIQDAAAKAAGESGCGCGPKVATRKSGCC
jgi:RNA polymerase sigma-70 factor, ECF subfamily